MNRTLLKLSLTKSLLLVVIFGSIGLTGCGGPTLVPVEGKVLYKGQPLTFGSVWFQPKSGQPATGVIQSDGTFSLETRGFGPGAVVGTHRVRVTCFESQRPQSQGSASDEMMVGQSLIPRKYTNIDTSGLVQEIPPEGKTDLVLELQEQ